jgi:hypothetical protein
MFNPPKLRASISGSPCGNCRTGSVLERQLRENTPDHELRRRLRSITRDARATGRRPNRESSFFRCHELF